MKDQKLSKYKRDLKQLHKVRELLVKLYKDQVALIEINCRIAVKQSQIEKYLKCRLYT